VAGAPLTVDVTAAPGHPSNVVYVLYRIDYGPVCVAHAVPVGSGARTDSSQRFEAVLPRLSPGQRLEYRAELRRVGQLLAWAPRDTTWNSSTANTSGPDAEPSASSPSGSPGQDLAGTPRFGYSLEFLGALTVSLRAEVMGETPEGYRINFFIREGAVHGPRMNGTVRSGEGSDYMLIDPGGVGRTHVHLTYEMSGGGLVLEISDGIFYTGPGGYERITRGIFEGTAPYIGAPLFTTASPQWGWMNSIQCVGLGWAVLDELRVESDIYTPWIKSGRSGA
jgi:hypothetical protein